MIAWMFTTVAYAELRMHLYKNTALGGPVALNGTTSNGLSGPTSVGCDNSAEFIGTLVAPLQSLLGFAADVDPDTSSLRLWVDDFLVLEFTNSRTPASSFKRIPGNHRRINGVLALPSTVTDGRPMMVRIRYIRTCIDDTNGKAGWLSLLWNATSSKNAEAPFVVVPASSFSTDISGPQEQREALRRRLYEPPIPWQTYVHSSMGAHTLQPTGLVVRLGIVDLQGDTPEHLGGDAGNILPWSRFVPAHTLPGRHSLNGSDYTSFEVRGWGKNNKQQHHMTRRDARVVVETTTLLPDGRLCNEAPGMRCDLLAVATCHGTDCDHLGVSLSGTFEWGRAGEVLLTNTTDLTFTPVGFPAVTVYAGTRMGLSRATPARPLRVKPARPLRVFPFAGSGAQVGVSTGRRRDVATMVTAITAARVRAEVVPAHLEDVATLALPLFDILVTPA